MDFDNAYHVRPATVTDFDFTFIANLVEPNVRGKVLVNKVEKLFANFYF